MNLKLKILALLVLFFGMWVQVSGQESAQKTDQVQLADNKPDYPMATVGENNVMASTVNRHVKRVVGDRTLTVDQLAKIRNEALEHLIKRELARQYLTVRGYKATKGQVQIEIDLLVANLERVGKTLDEHLQDENRTLEGIQSETQWKIIWASYLKKTLTDDVLQKYFDRHRRKFDGTELRLAQILFQVDEDEVAVIQSALETKRQIQAGDLTWKSAVEKNSIAASKSNSGEVGWIRFQEPMPVEFSRRAFELELDQISEPFGSQFGVHLIKCLEVKPGTAGLGDVRETVETVATKDLFYRISELHRSEVSVELTR